MLKLAFFRVSFVLKHDWKKLRPSEQAVRRRRLLIVDLSKRYGGVDTRVLQLASGLAPWLDVAVAVLEGSQTHEVFAGNGIQLYPIRRNRKDPRLLGDLIGCIRSVRPDIVDTQNPQSALWGLPAAVACGVRVRVATIHSVYEESEKHKFANVIYGGLYKLINATATDVVAVSDNVKDHLLRRGIAQQRLKIIYNGVAISRLDLPRQVKTNPLKIACVGRLVPVKGQSILLKAIAKLVAENNDVACLLIGDGPERSRLEELAQSLGIRDKVDFLGMRRDVASVLEECDVLCLPSLSEGLPFAALEAAGLGLPIVATSVGGMARHFSSGDTAILVPPAQEDALADALKTVVASPDQAGLIGWRGWRMVSEQYSIEQMLRESAALFANEGSAINAGSADRACGKVDT